MPTTCAGVEGIKCYKYDADKVFKRFRVMEFPTSFVGLYTEDDLELDANLVTSTYLRTTCQRQLMTFEEARKISARHKAYRVKQTGEEKLRITYHPTSECIYKAKTARYNELDNRFVFDLRLIKVDGTRCCNNEVHSEVARYYISGQYEYCKLKHFPQVIDFGDVHLLQPATKQVRIRNDSDFIAANMYYIHLTGCEVTPVKFVIPPHATKKITVTFRPTCLKTGEKIQFKIRNPYDLSEDVAVDQKDIDDNYLIHTIPISLNVLYKPKHRELAIESMHKLFEHSPIYTYVGEEIKIQQERQTKALKLLEQSKSKHGQKPVISKCTGKVTCYSESSSEKLIPKVKGKDFCTVVKKYVSGSELFNIALLPFSLDFGEISINTYGVQTLTIKNGSRCDTTIRLLDDNYILYTTKKCVNLKVNMKAWSETNVVVLCRAFVTGTYTGSFRYSIDNKYRLRQVYTIRIGNPKIMVQEGTLKFGMITNEMFVTNVPVRIINNFNTTVDFHFEELNSDIPFTIIPKSGSVPHRTSRLCDISYVCSVTKAKTHEINLYSDGPLPKMIPIELNVLSRKLSIKVLNANLVFKDIPINTQCTDFFRLENSSREMALFQVLEPILPGITIEPMSGIIRPKMILSFKVTVKILCPVDFAFDVFIKINNKEQLSLPVIGGVFEPKLTIHPKNIFMPRVPAGLVTYVPVSVQNAGTVRATVDVLDTGDENIFHVFVASGNEKEPVHSFSVDVGQTKTIFIKVYDVYRREYEQYIPLRINELLGPPNELSWSTELHHYVGAHEEQYENNLKVKLRNSNKDIPYCRITGVITLEWIRFSVDKFEIRYVPNGANRIFFSMTNISKCYLYITIVTSKLSPYFTLKILSHECHTIINENNSIKFEMDRGDAIDFSIHFHPKGHGRFVSVATLFLDKLMSLPFSNLTFIGIRQPPKMTPSVTQIIFPPIHVNKQISREITLRLEAESCLDPFRCSSSLESNVSVKFLDCKVIREGDKCCTLVKVLIKVSCCTTYSCNLSLVFHHELFGSSCDVEVNFCASYCPLTLHTSAFVKPEDSTYPYYPLKSQTELYNYLETSKDFLEKWMFQQGFRRELYPEIPDTFLALSFSSAASAGVKNKGMNVSYLSFVRRIAGPLIKYIRRIVVHCPDESFKVVKETHDTYAEILNLLFARGTILWHLQAKFLLSYEQFKKYTENVAPKGNSEILLTTRLLADPELFSRLNKQSWIDFILQSYKVFVLDSCFFECVCVTGLPRDIIKILCDWYNDQIIAVHEKLRGKNHSLKTVKNLTKDLIDGIAIISAFLSFCPFLEEHFSIFSEIDEKDPEGTIIHNACLITEAMNLLKIYFPIRSVDILKPNSLQMLFFSVHLYVTLPMFAPKDEILFQPPLLKSSTRLVAITPTSQESLTFSYVLLNNNHTCFSVEKTYPIDNGKKMMMTLKYTAKFVKDSHCILLVHGYNKTRIFDTYILFRVTGKVSALQPYKKCKVSGPQYRPVKVDVVLTSPFSSTATYDIFVTDKEPSLPMIFEPEISKKWYFRRLYLIDKQITLTGEAELLEMNTGGTDNASDQKLYLTIICLSTQLENSWIWFRSEIGEFFVRVTTQTRIDQALDTFVVKVDTWPMDPCSCGESCECYRTTVLGVPHRNENMVRALRAAVLENATDIMIKIFDELIETPTGRIILSMLLLEGGSNMSDVHHILRSKNTYEITSKNVFPRLERATLHHHSDGVLTLPITLPPNDHADKYSITLTSECGMDVRTFKIMFVGNDTESI